MVKELVKCYWAKYGVLETNQTFLTVLKMMLEHKPVHTIRMLVLLAQHVCEFKMLSEYM